MDTTFEFEARRNRPVKYDRDLMSRTIAGIQKVEEIKGAREVDFYTSRMKDSHALKKKQARVEIEKGKELVKPAAGRVRETEAKRGGERKIDTMKKGEKEMVVE